ncbi:MAG: mechanosensitive ion channel family protein [Acidimicrobiia bacterium]|nr:mechanosensitive ion channel family protein [Acidimicrobiia bacterium]
MTTTDWIIVAAAIIGGIAVGVIASRIVIAVLGGPNRPGPIRDASPAVGSLAMSIGIVVGLIVALGVVSPDSLDQLPRDVIDFIPRLLAAAIIVIVANVLSSFAQAALAPALARMPASVQRQALSAVRITIITLAVLLAVRQLGFDTTVINLGVAAIFFGISGALMLLVALGGRAVATEVASTRVLRRLLQEGDRVELDTVQGTVVSVHPTAIELDTVDGRRILVPSSRFVGDTVTIERSQRSERADQAQRS